MTPQINKIKYGFYYNDATGGLLIIEEPTGIQAALGLTLDITSLDVLYQDNRYITKEYSIFTIDDMIKSGYLIYIGEI